MAGQGQALCPLLHLLRTARQPYVVCLPFMALGGAGDDFTGPADVETACKQSLRLHPSAVPSLKILDRHGLELPINSYALDFLKHGSSDDIVNAKKIRESELYTLLLTMDGVLSAIALSLELVTEEEGQDVNAAVAMMFKELQPAGF